MITLVLCSISFFAGAAAWHLIGRNNPKLRVKGDALADRAEQELKERRGGS